MNSLTIAEFMSEIRSLKRGKSKRFPLKLKGSLGEEMLSGIKEALASEGVKVRIEVSDESVLVTRRK